MSFIKSKDNNNSNNSSFIVAFLHYFIYFIQTYTNFYFDLFSMVVYMIKM